MPNPPNTSGIRDSRRHGRVAEFLRSKIKDGTQLSAHSPDLLAVNIIEEGKV